MRIHKNNKKTKNDALRQKLALPMVKPVKKSRQQSVNEIKKTQLLKLKSFKNDMIPKTTRNSPDYNNNLKASKIPMPKSEVKTLIDHKKSNSQQQNFAKRANSDAAISQ